MASACHTIAHSSCNQDPVCSPNCLPSLTDMQCRIITPMALERSHTERRNNAHCAKSNGRNTLLRNPCISTYRCTYTSGLAGTCDTIKIQANTRPTKFEPIDMAAVHVNTNNFTTTIQIRSRILCVALLVAHQHVRCGAVVSIVRPGSFAF